MSFVSQEKRQLERLESKANQLEAYEKAKSAKAGAGGRLFAGSLVEYVG